MIEWQLLETHSGDEATVLLWDGDEPVAAHWRRYPNAPGGFWQIHQYDYEGGDPTHWASINEPTESAAPPDQQPAPEPAEPRPK